MHSYNFDEIKKALERRRRHAGKGMLIVVIEDDDEQRQYADQVLSMQGNVVFTFSSLEEDRMSDQNFVLDCIENCDGIISDFNFDPRGYGSSDSKPTREPGGLLSIFLAMTLGKPIVVCSKMAYEYGHGGSFAQWILKHQHQISFPVVISEFDETTGIKDWSSAGKALYQCFLDKHV